MASDVEDALQLLQHNVCDSQTAIRLILPIPLNLFNSFSFHKYLFNLIDIYSIPLIDSSTSLRAQSTVLLPNELHLREQALIVLPRICV